MQFCVNKKKNLFDNFNKRVISNSKHSAFPDVVNYKGIDFLSYRIGNSHADDKGKLKILNLTSGDFIIIEDKSFDLRNAYFLSENSNLYLYCSVYDYINHSFERVNKYLIKIYDNKFNIELIEENDNLHQVYHPFNKNLGSFSKKVNDKWIVYPEKKDSLLMDDEEISFIQLDDKILGIGRNHKKAGLPLLYLEKTNIKWLVKNWCYGKNKVALVSPKLYYYDNKIILAYTERKINYYVNLYRLKIKESEESITKLRFYNSYKDIINCNSYKNLTINSGNNIDSGYPTLLFKKDSIFLYTYEQIENRISIVERKININNY